jgi:putative tricarboxylic transport membrane protein
MKLATSRAPGRRPVPRRAAKVVTALLACTALTSCAVLTGGDSGGYPSQSIEYVVPYKPGGSSDPVGREFSRMLADDLGTSANVFNKPGGDESIGITEVVRAQSDPHTLGLASSAGLLAQPMLKNSLQYDGYEDVTPIVQMINTPYALFVAEDSPYRTLDDLIQDAKKNPGKVRVGTANRMGNTAFCFYFLEKQAGVEMTIVPSSGGSGEAALATMGGQTEAFLATASGQRGLVESGDLRPLAYTGEEYGDVFPGATSFKDAGYDIPFTADYMTIAPAGLPDSDRTKLVEAARKIAVSEKWASWAKKQGNVPADVSGKELTQQLQEKRDKIKAAIELARSQR